MSSEIGFSQEGGNQVIAFSPQEVMQQVSLIQQIMKQVMQEGEHYGKIPGCGDKPTLLKSGAEKLNFTFQMSPKFEIAQKHYENGHREYQVVCSLYRIKTEQFLGQGVGICSTMENKYRFRWENTERVVPKEYWDSRNVELLGGPSFAPRKVEGKWLIFHKVEHDNPADYYNTILKMAKKRAMIDAVLTVTAASDIFTQDIEEMEGIIENKVPEGKKEGNSQPSISSFQKFILAMAAMKKLVGDNEYYATLNKFGFKHSNEIKTRQQQVEIYQLLDEILKIRQGIEQEGEKKEQGAGEKKQERDKKIAEVNDIIKELQGKKNVLETLPAQVLEQVYKVKNVDELPAQLFEDWYQMWRTFEQCYREKSIDDDGIRMELVNMLKNAEEEVNGKSRI